MLCWLQFWLFLGHMRFLSFHAGANLDYGLEVMTQNGLEDC
jgi:hypothetical protein